MRVKMQFMGLAMAVSLSLAGAASAQDRLIQQGTDSVTGAVVRAFRTPTGSRLEVQTSSLLVKKSIDGETLTTSLSGGGESLVITQTTDRLSVSGTRGRASVSTLDDKDVSRAQRLVAESPIAGRAAALIGKMGFGARTPIEPMLLTTRALLLSARGDDAGRRDLAGWMSRVRNRNTIVKVGFQERTPTQCWEAYIAELDAAWADFEKCMNSLRWYHVFGGYGCSVPYELRLVGAFTWYLDCVKLLGFIIG